MITRLPDTEIEAAVAQWSAEDGEHGRRALVMVREAGVARELAYRLFDSAVWKRFVRSAGAWRLENENGDVVMFRTYRQGLRGCRLNAAFVDTDCPAGVEAALIPCLAIGR